MQKIIVAKTAGFCMGVKRAVDMTMEIIRKGQGPIYTYGPLIHNPQVIKLLTEKEVTIIDNCRIPECGTVVIRAHGILPGIKRELEKADINLCDATCPYVIKVQRIISDCARQRYTVIIIGDKGHAEVESYLGYSGGRGVVIEPGTFDGVRGIPDADRYCVVAQTTQDRQIYNEIVRALKRVFKGKLEVYNTICNATGKRQREAVRLSTEADAVIVVGGRNSANTLRLFNKCRAKGTPTYFVERTGELNLNEISAYNTVGITAGASTPQEVIQEVVDYIRCKTKN